MKEYFGKKLKDGDYVIYKAKDKWSNLEIGLVCDGATKVQTKWDGRKFSPSNDVVLLDPGEDTTHYAECKKLSDHLHHIKAKRDFRRDSKLKKSEFQRFHIYARLGEERWSSEVYLGPCEIEGTTYKNCWIQVHYEPSDGTMEAKRRPLRGELWRGQMHYHGSGIAPTRGPEEFYKYNIRDCSLPVKHIDMGTIPEEEVYEAANIVLHAKRGEVL